MNVFNASNASNVLNASNVFNVLNVFNAAKMSFMSQDKYHGIKVSLFTSDGKKTTVCMFKRGVMIVTGLKTSTAFEPAARYMLSAFYNLNPLCFIHEEVETIVVSTTKKKRKMLIDDIAASLGL